MQAETWVAVYFAVTSILGAVMAGYEISGYGAEDQEYAVPTFLIGTFFGWLLVIPLLACWCGAWIRAALSRATVDGGENG